MLLKGVGWAVIGYAFGIFGFAFTEFIDTFGSMDLVSAMIHSLVEGVKWPGTFIDLVTGNLDDKSISF
jgi:hypothetical protein